MKTVIVILLMIVCTSESQILFAVINSTSDKLATICLAIISISALLFCPSNNNIRRGNDTFILGQLVFPDVTGATIHPY
uniref:Uncharacterized protein n=1 Tax=Timema genevievae TaxID=629358 RepID=A0A7R9PK02_TIMGE|nr:unnamed protein product [Timema genevievae]